MRRNLHCCLCGELRRPTQTPVQSFGNNVECISIKQHRPLLDGRWEESPLAGQRPEKRTSATAA
jgi:hypothetical protein